MSKGVLIIKLFKTLLITIPCFIVAVLILVALPESTDNYIIDLEGDLDAFDEPTYVTNSDMSFFYKNDQLSTYREQKKPEKVTYFKMSENIVTTDYTKEHVTVVPDTSKEYMGSKSLIMYDGGIFEYTGSDHNNYILKGGEAIPKEESFEIILDHSILGHSDSTPHRISKGNTYYAAFTSELDSMYFEFTSNNEFVSVIVEELTGRVEFTLLNSKMEPIKNGWNNSQNSIEIQYKGKGSEKYYLKLTGSYNESLTPYTIKLPFDDNEWLWQMSYSEFGAENVGKLDYYGDEDYFVLPPAVTENINKSVLRFTSAQTETNVVIYDKERNIIGQYVYKPQETDIISLYGLTNAYAVAVYSYNGESSGTTYSFLFEHTEISLLDIETYGFTLSPEFNDETYYYTATVKSLADKKITDVMHSLTEIKTEIAVKQQSDDKIYTVKLGDELPLADGRNTITLTVEFGGMKKVITIVVSHNPEVLSFTKFKYTETTMPESYSEKINALKELYPDWKFTFVKTGWDFNSYVNSQVTSSFTAQEVAYRVDPRNFFDVKNIFMFENAKYSSDANYSMEGIKGIWDSDEYASYIMDAAVSTGLSPYFIAGRSALESGRGTSKLAKGIVDGYEGYYNFFGIGASDIDPNNGGAALAKKENWNSKRRAIIEGAAWINRYYISAGQPTVYFMKFCFIPNYNWHQYMSDIAAPAKDAQFRYSAYASAGTLSEYKEFIIPVFENMP